MFTCWKSLYTGTVFDDYWLFSLNTRLLVTLVFKYLISSVKINGLLERFSQHIINFGKINTWTLKGNYFLWWISCNYYGITHFTYAWRFRVLLFNLRLVNCSAFATFIVIKDSRMEFMLSCDDKQCHTCICVCCGKQFQSFSELFSFGFEYACKIR